MSKKIVHCTVHGSLNGGRAACSAIGVGTNVGHSSADCQYQTPVAVQVAPVAKASDSKHTPGPWQVAYLDQNGQAVVKGEHIEIASCWHHCVGSIEKEMYANAHLIAAAPDMLNVLLRARDVIEALDGTTVENEKLVDDYRTLVAKVQEGGVS